MSREKPTTRERILDSVLRMLESGRGAGVRMADIAKETGVSRQAVYLHFPTRSELLVAAARHVDTLNGVDERLAKSRQASSGLSRLDAFIEAWGNYIPVVYPFWTALSAMKDSDEAARAAIEDRDHAIRDGCEAAVGDLGKDGRLSSEHSQREATDILCALLSIETWERLTHVCRWSQARYITKMKALSRAALLALP